MSETVCHCLIVVSSFLTCDWSDLNQNWPEITCRSSLIPFVELKLTFTIFEAASMFCLYYCSHHLSSSNSDVFLSFKKLRLMQCIKQKLTPKYSNTCLNCSMKENIQCIPNMTKSSIIYFDQ